MISITDAAADALRRLLEDAESGVQEDGARPGLKLGVDRGGCAGLQYAMRVGVMEEGDYVHEEAGVRVLIDRESLPFVRGSTVDYHESLNDSGFKITNPNAARSCGCGTSFEPADGSVAPADPGSEGSIDDCEGAGLPDEKDTKIR